MWFLYKMKPFRFLLNSSIFYYFSESFKIDFNTYNTSKSKWKITFFKHFVKSSIFTTIFCLTETDIKWILKLKCQRKCVFVLQNIIFRRFLNSSSLLFFWIIQYSWNELKNHYFKQFVKNSIFTATLRQDVFLSPLPTRSRRIMFKNHRINKISACTICDFL